MKIMLVTGGAGFIGSNFIKYFLRRNKNFIVANIDKQTYPFEMDRMAELENSPRYHHIKGDVCNRDLTEYVLRKYRPTWIVNFCSEPLASVDVRKFQASGEISFTGTLALLEGARYIWARSSTADKRFIQVSTDEVYGLPGDEKVFCDEDAPLMPENPFSAVKAGADLMASAYFKAFNLPTVILRSCCTYGPWQDLRCTVPSLIKSVLHDNMVTLHSASPVKEWIHVSDLCSAITRALFFARPGETYNIGSGESASYADLAAILLKLAGKPAERLPVTVKSQNREGTCRLNSYRAKCNLKWSNSFDLEEGLKDTMHWYESQRTLTN